MLEMMSFENTFKLVTKICYHIICIIFCVFVIYMLINQFSGNKDSSEVSYKKFADAEDEKISYPTFSICTPGVYGSIFSPLFETELYYILKNHSECLESGSTPPWCEIGLYQNMLLGREELLPEVAAQNVEEISKSVLKKTKRYILDDNRAWHYYDKIAMNLSYQDSLRICFTKLPEPGMGRNHTYDLYGIKAKSLNLPIEVYIHQVGGLIEQIGKKYVLLISKTEIRELYDNFETTKPSSSKNQGITVFNDFHIRKIELLRKRPDAVKSCNEDINNNDEVYKDAVVKKVGCIPSYWKPFFKNRGNENLPDCNTKNQFEQLSNMLPMLYENTNLYNGSKLYEPPCREMKIMTTTNKRNERSVNHKLWLGFYYDADEDLEILNNEAYTSYDLWSQMGGIVGIFLGYSILQVTFEYNIEI